MIEQFIEQPKNKIKRNFDSFLNEALLEFYGDYADMDTIEDKVTCSYVFLQKLAKK